MGNIGLLPSRGLRISSTSLSGGCATSSSCVVLLNFNDVFLYLMVFNLLVFVFSALNVNWTYGMIEILRTKSGIRRWAPSCRAKPAGACLTQHFSMYRLPFLVRGITSPEPQSMSHPNRLPNRDSNPMSAHLLRLSNPLCTSATCIVMFLTLLAPSVQISRRRSPRFGIDAPLAT